MQGLDLLELTLIIVWFIAVGFYLISGFLFVRQSFKYAEEPRVKILAFVGFFLILAAISRLLHPIIFIFNNEQEFIFYISQGIFIAAIIMLVFYLERVIYTASHYIFTIILVIGETLFVISEISLHYGVILIGPEFFSLIVAFVMASAGLFMAVLYLRIAIQSSGEPRRDAIYILIGGVLFACSYLISGLEKILLSLDQVALIASILTLLALPFFVKGFRLSL